MKRLGLILTGILLMAVVRNEILSLIVLCVFCVLGVVRLFEAMIEHNIL